MMRSVSNVQQSCDIDAFICQNELDFIIPQEIVSTPFVMKQQQQPVARLTTKTSNEEVYSNDPIGEILNDMINFSMGLPITMISSSGFLPVEQPQTTASTSLSELEVMDKIMDDMLSSFFDAASSKDRNPTIFIERINNHGRRLLQEETNPVREHIARRLTSIQHPPRHLSPPIGPSMVLFDSKVDQCLFKRLRDHTLLSNNCGKELQDFHRSNLISPSSSSEEYYLLDPASFVVVLTTLFIFTTTTLLLFKILLNSSASSPRRLKRSILHAVYSNHAIKQQVEQHLGEEIGTGLRYHHHRRFSTPIGRCCAALPLMALTILLCYLSVTDPTVVILVGAPVVFALGCFTCCFAEPEADEQQQNESVTAYSTDVDDGLPPPLLAPQGAATLKGEDYAVFVAVPAVI